MKHQLDDQLLAALSNAPGVSGAEEALAQVIAPALKDGIALMRDPMNNLTLRYKRDAEAKAKGDAKRPVLMLDSHLDEVGFMVQSIDPYGLLRIVPLGGWVASNIPAQLVDVHTDSGVLTGVVASKPPHFMSPEERKAGPRIEDLRIDLGTSSYEETLAKGVKVGDMIVPHVQFSFDGKFCRGKAFDNRLGTYTLLQVMNALKDKSDELAVELVGSMAAQEEVGCRGSLVATHRIKPDFAIVFEGTPADDTFTPAADAQSVLGKGPQIRFRDMSYISHRGFIKAAREIAERHNIPVQYAVRTGGGTNAGSIHLANEATPVLVIGIPTRYAHTHQCYASASDIEQAVHLGTELIMAFQEIIPHLSEEDLA